MRIRKVENRDDGRALALLFLGYAFTPESVSHLSAGPYDFAVVHDYRNLDFDRSFLKNRKIILIAWSMGVWAANKVLGGVPLQSAVAINGTPFGIHDRFGIPRETFRKTIENFDFELFKKWCFLADIAKAEFPFSENPKEELRAIYEASAPSEPVSQNIAWTKAIVSKKDLVFPPKASECFECPVRTLPAPHYPFFKLRSVEEILAF